jgi:hypothetical protein
MGLKRKASVLEDAVYDHHEQRSPSAPSLTYSSSPTSTNTLSSPAHNFHHDSVHAPYDLWQIQAVPLPYYLNSRTRKRHRDDRPEEDIVHEHTLKKLYDAQRLHLDEALPIRSEVSDHLDTQAQEKEEDEDIDMMSDEQPLAELPRSPQRNQRTLEAFFGGRNRSTAAATIRSSGSGHQGQHNSRGSPTAFQRAKCEDARRQCGDYHFVSQSEPQQSCHNGMWTQPRHWPTMATLPR